MTKIEDIELDYAENKSIFNDEPDKVRKVKHIIWNDLTLIERRIIILYAEMKCMRLVAETIGVSTSTICHTIVNIRKKIKEILNNDKHNN